MLPDALRPNAQLFSLPPIEVALGNPYATEPHGFCYIWKLIELEGMRHKWMFSRIGDGIDSHGPHVIIPPPALATSTRSASKAAIQSSEHECEQSKDGGPEEVSTSQAELLNQLVESVNQQQRQIHTLATKLEGLAMRMKDL